MTGIFSRPPILIAAMLAVIIATMLIGCGSPRGSGSGSVMAAAPAPVKTVYKQAPSSPFVTETAALRHGDESDVIKSPAILSSVLTPIYRPALSTVSNETPEFRPYRGPPLVDSQQAEVLRKGFAGFDHSRARERV